MYRNKALICTTVNVSLIDLNVLESYGKNIQSVHPINYNNFIFFVRPYKADSKVAQFPALLRNIGLFSPKIDFFLFDRNKNRIYLGIIF